MRLEWPFLVALVLSALSTSAADSACPTEPCDLEFKDFRDISHFSIDNVPLPYISKYAMVVNQSEAGCFINSTAMIEAANIPKSTVLVVTYVLVCKIPTRVHLLPYTGSYKYENAVSYLQTANCLVNFEDVNNFAKATDGRVYTLLKTKYANHCLEHSQEKCEALKGMVSLAYENTDDNPPNISQILACGQTFQNVAEVVFSNMSWTVLPSSLQTLFPNLQALDLADNKLARPPDFPWSRDVMTLPRNLSRSRFFQNHYSGVLHLDIPANVFRRILLLDRNQIRNLTDYEFTGMLHMISVRENKLQGVGAETFRNVRGLQSLDLGKNELTSFPASCFHGLRALHHLNLEDNKLTSIPADAFQDLQALRNLDLANNSLTSLPDGVFSSLVELSVVKLEHNRLTVLSADSFPVQSLKLREVVLRNNPLQELPQFLFWLRGLVTADLANTSITFNNFSHYLGEIDSHRLLESVVDSISDSNVDVLRKAAKFRVIDLSNCNVTLFQLRNVSDLQKKVMIVLLQNFKFVLTGNPLFCSCGILPLNDLISELRRNGTIDGDEYYFSDWRCQGPSELTDTAMLTVKPEDTYCPVHLETCPRECSCFRRSVSNTTIVDCRGRGLTQIHPALPRGRLELWYSRNNISVVTGGEHLSHVVRMDLANNRLSGIANHVFQMMPSLQQLNLDSNLLTYLPESLKNKNLKSVSFLQNAIVCDCHSLWLKRWISRSQGAIENWNHITCTVSESESKEILQVPDSDFVCKEEFDSLRHVVVPAVVSSVIVFLLLAALIIVYAYRLECKVLMYIYLGVHPFDRDARQSEAYEGIDFIIIHSGQLTDWVMERIVAVLEKKEYNYVVVDMARDFVVGFSFQENLSRIVRHSKRMILCLSQDWEESNDSFKLAWHIAKEKIKETKTNYGIIISHGVEPKVVKDKDLRRFLKRGRYIDSKKNLFVEKIMYSLPHEVKRGREVMTEDIMVRRCFSEVHYEGFDDRAEAAATNDGVKCHAFVAYADTDTDYVTKQIQPCLEAAGYQLCIADRDFIPGASKEENILTAINISMRTIFILSGSHLQDEWSLFIFRTAYEKSLREKSNHLLVIVMEDVDLETMDEEIRQYLKSYISLNVRDLWFQQKLLNGLPLLTGAENHTSPLFVSQLNIDNQAFEKEEEFQLEIQDVT